MREPGRIAKVTPLAESGGWESGIFLKTWTGSVVWEWEHIITIGLAKLSL